ncbi:MAG TPA: sugar ABC transporter permease [Ignavibacteriaceae bacterium]|nr:sugar ABC transporter permease [Ignavibacteriaceae bacterium]
MKLFKTLGKEKDNSIGFIFLGIPLFINCVFLFYPIIYSFILSLFDWNLLMHDKYFIGFDNFIELFTDKIFLISIKNTLIYTAGVVPLQTIVALLMAVLLNQKVRGRPFFRTAFYIPSITSSVVTSVIFMWIYAKPGLLNYLLSLMGISGPDWLASTDFALSSIMMLNIWSTAGYFMITFLASLQNIPESLYETARVDGANKFRMFWNITVPMVRPAIFFVVTLGMIGCFQVFDQIYVMSSGGPANATTTMSYFIYQNAFKYFRMGYASAASVVLFLFILFFTLIQKKYYRMQV